MNTPVAMAFVDDDADQRINTKAQFERSSQFEVDTFSPDDCPSLTDYDPILGEGYDVVVVDFNLRQSSDVTYNGLELARHLRSRKRLMPLVVLTGHSDDAETQELSRTVDIIVEKSKFNSDDFYYQATIDRILRLAERHESAVDKLEGRYEELIHLKLTGALNDAQKEEYERLRHEVDRPTEAESASRSDAVQQAMENAIKAAKFAKETAEGLAALRKEVERRASSSKA